MNRVGQKKQAAPKRARERFEDCNGIAFDEVRLILPAERRLWPVARLVVDPDVCRLMHERFGRCWECGAYPVQVHHMIEGAHGRSDELANACVLCADCHGQNKRTIIPLGRQQFLKWDFDRVNTDWVRLTIVRGRWLDELITKG